MIDHLSDAALWSNESERERMINTIKIEQKVPIYKPIGKILSEEEMGIGFDRKAGNVIWFGERKPGLLYIVR